MTCGVLLDAVAGGKIEAMASDLSDLAIRVADGADVAALAELRALWSADTEPVGPSRSAWPPGWRRKESAAPRGWPPWSTCRSAWRPCSSTAACRARTGGLAVGLRRQHVRAPGQPQPLSERRCWPRSSLRLRRAPTRDWSSPRVPRRCRSTVAQASSRVRKAPVRTSCSCVPAQRDDDRDRWPGQPASSRTTVSTRSTSACVVRKFVMQARRAKRPSTVAFDR